MLKLRAIDEDGLEAAADLLTKGFPSRSRAFWLQGLRRLAAYNRRTGVPSLGTFLMADDRPVGILLTIVRRDRQTGRKRVNLSSWYVEEAHRWSAVRLVMAAVADKEAIYTDLTPTETAAEVNARFGFRSFDIRQLILFAPWLALVGPGKGRLRPLSAAPTGAVTETLLQDLREHIDLGCIVCTLEIDGRHHPIVFDVITRKGIPAARVVFAEDRHIVTNNLGPIARMLTRCGIPLLTLQVGRDEHVPHAWVWKPELCYQVRGEWDDRMINELYSERVLLKV